MFVTKSDIMISAGNIPLTIWHGCKRCTSLGEKRMCLNISFILSIYMLHNNYTECLDVLHIKVIFKQILLYIRSFLLERFICAEWMTTIVWSHKEVFPYNYITLRLRCISCLDINNTIMYVTLRKNEPYYLKNIFELLKYLKKHTTT